MEWNAMEWNAMRESSVAECNAMRESSVAESNARSVTNKNNCIVKDVNFIFYYIENLLSLLYNSGFMLLHYKI
jgi:hypothetical protein